MNSEFYHWRAYRTRCDRPDVMTRWALDASRARAPVPVRRAIARVLASRPIDKPADHRGGPETDCFVVDLSPGEAEGVIAALEQETDRRLRHLAIVWQEYRDACGSAGGTIRGSS